MTNERLRAAIRVAGLTTNELSERIQVDPKTVERWITNGRSPHRANRQAVARILDRDEAHIWPGEFDPAEASAEVVHLYTTRGKVPTSTWVYLLENAQDSIDIVAFAGSFLHDAVPGFNELLRQRAEAGVRVRLLFGDPESQAVSIRGAEEGIGGSLAERCRLTWKYLAPLQEVEGVAMRIHGCTLYTSIFRFDDDILANHHLFGAAASQSPVIHVRNLGLASLAASHLMAFESIWQLGKPSRIPSLSPSIGLHGSTPDTSPPPQAVAGWKADPSLPDRTRRNPGD